MRILLFSLFFLTLFFNGAAGLSADPGEEVSSGSESLVSAEPAMPAEEPPSLDLLFAGDTHFLWGIADIQKRSGLLAPISEIRDLFINSDFRVLNLETAVTEKGSPFPEKSHIFNANPKNVALLKELSIDLAVVGNNHIMDMGKEGLEGTLENLRMAAIPAVGAGDNRSGALAPYYFEREGIRFAILSLCQVGETGIFSGNSSPGVAYASRYALRSVQQAKQFADIVIVNIHWGFEYRTEPTRAQIRYAHSLIDAGATAVVGHHPHIPQGVELYRRGVILYSLGNFLFGSVNQFQSSNMVAELFFEKKRKRLRKVRIVPITGAYRHRGHVVRRLSGQEAADFWSEFYLLSSRLSPSIKGAIRLLKDGAGEILIGRD